MKILLFLNLTILLLFRVTVKYNFVLKSLGILSVFLQVLVVLILPFRDRSFISGINLNLIFVFFLTITFLPIIIPYFINCILSDNRKLKLIEIEKKVTLIFYYLLYDIQLFFKKHLFFYRIIEIKVKKILDIFIIFCLGNARKFIYLVFFGIPWLFFVFHFYEALYFLNFEGFSKTLVYFGIFIFTFRIYKGLLFLSKSRIWQLFTDYFLSVNPDLYSAIVDWIELFFLSKPFLIDQIFGENKEMVKNIQETKTWWKNLNILLYYYLYYAIIKFLLDTEFPKIRRLFFWLNFFAISLGIVFFFSIFSGIIYLILIPFFLAIILNDLAFRKDAWEEKLQGFLKDLPGFLNDYKLRLVKEKNFTFVEAAVGLNKPFPKFPRNFFLFKEFWYLFCFGVVVGFILINPLVQEEFIIGLKIICNKSLNYFLDSFSKIKC